MIRAICAVVAILSFGWVAPAWAKPPELKFVANTGISVNMARLAVDVGEFKGERHFGKWAIAAVANHGLTTRAWGGGVQALYGLLGDYGRGVQVGVEGRYETKIRQDSGNDPSQVDLIDSKSTGWALGTFVQSRYAGSTGAFIGGQFGVRRMWTTTTSTCCGGSFVQSSGQFWPLVALDVGVVF